MAPSPDDQNQNRLEMQSSREEPKEHAKRCADIRLYTLNLAAMIIFHLSMAVYTVGVIRTVERRFGFSSKQTGLIMAMNDVSHIMIVVFIGYIGRKAHKPKFLSVSILLTAVNGVLMASANFIFPANKIVSSISMNSTSGGSEINGMYCSPAYGVEDGSGMCSSESSLHTAEATAEASHQAFILFAFAQLLGGIGGSGISPLGLAYIDENSPKNKSSVYLGIVMGLFALGPVAGFMLSAITLRIPEIPWDPESADPDDPTFIGAWWLGYLICSVGIIIAAIPMWFFPKHIIPPKAAIVRKQSITPTNRSRIAVIRREFRDFLPSLGKMVRNKPYMVILASYVMIVYIITGIYTNIPRYVEIHFLLPAFVGSIVAGCVSALAGMVGGFLGGFIMARMKLKVPGAALLMIFSLCFSVLGIVVSMVLGCPQINMGGVMDETTNQLDVDALTCNDDCGCMTQKTSYRPVCGSDNVTYFSPCHAGCHEGANGTYTSCSCLGDGGTARDGVCAPPCALLYPYAATLLVVSLFSSTGRVPSTIIQFRIVDEDMRSFALGLTSFAVNLLGMIPAPILFGAIIDSTCILWEYVCGQRGACLIFDVTLFRLLTHGVSLCFLMCGFILYIVVYFLVRNKQFDNDVRPTEAINIKNSSQDKNGTPEGEALMSSKANESKI